MGSVNVIWQGDANEYAVRSLLHCDTSTENSECDWTGNISVRWLAEEFGTRFEKKPLFVNEEQPTALLNNASKAHQLFGYPKVSLQQMIDMTADWYE